jgi:hypothetical protein
MFGFVIGTVCLIGLIKVLRHGHAWGHHGWGGWGGFRGGGCGYGHGGYGRCGGGWHEGREERGGDFDVPYEGRRGPRGPFGFGFGGFGPRAFLRGLFERLDTTPGQEKVILQAVDEVREAMHGARGEVGKTRAEVAQAFGREHFDAEVMGTVFSRHDDAIANVRKAFVGALSKVHEALDERQRKIFAELVESRFGGGLGFGGPYRGGRW